MDRQKIERICREAGMRPEAREHYHDHDIFVADGMSLSPHQPYKKFGVSSGDFPSGMYVTLWWVSRQEDKLDTGQPLFFDILHNPELDLSTRKYARINRALKEARGFIDRRKRISLDG